MNTLSRVYWLFLHISGIPDFWSATQAAHYWLSASVLLRSVAALWLVSCTLVFSVRAVRVALPRMSLPLHWASIMGVGTWTATMGFHALRGLGLFNLTASLLSCTALAACAVFIQPERSPWLWALRRERRALVAVARLFGRSKYWVVSALFVGYVVLTAARSLIVPPLGWDTITYHGPRMVHWLQTGQFTYDPGPGPYDLYRYFFSGGEVLMAWALVPFHSDLFANLTNIVQWVGVGSATWGLSRVIGVREPFAATSAGLIVLFPVLAFEMSAGYVEAPLNLALLHGIALALWCLQKPNGAVAVAASMSLGVAAGIKLPGAPPGVIVLAVLLVRMLFVKRHAWGHRVRSVALSCVGFALPLLPWIYQAYAKTRYPLSPMPIKVLGITLGVVSPALQWYQERDGPVPYSWPYEGGALRMLFSGVSAFNDYSGASLGSPALIPLIMALIGIVVLLRKRRLIALTLFAAMLAPWAAHFSTGLSIPRLWWPVSVARYLIVLMGMALPVSMAWCKPGSPTAQVYRRVVLVMSLWQIGLSLRFGFGAWEMRELMIVLVVCSVLGTLVHAALRSPNERPIWQRIALAVIVFAVGCSALQLRRDQTRALAYGTSFAVHNSPRYWASAVPLLDDELRTPHRLAITSGPLQNSDNWFSYFLFGSRFQNTVHYVTPTRDGGIAHFGPHGNLDLRADLDSWLKRLDTRKITDVMTFPPSSIEQRWMDAAPDKFEKLTGGHDWGLYRRRKR